MLHSRVLVAVLILCLAVSSAQASHADQADTWTETLKTIDEQLRTGEYHRARFRSVPLTREMFETTSSGSGAASTLTCVFPALAEVGLGDEEEVRCYWEVAHGLYPGSGDADMSPYGRPAEILRKAPVPAAREIRDLEKE